MRSTAFLVLASLALAPAMGCPRIPPQAPTEETAMENDARAFVQAHAAEHARLERAMNQAYWTATNGGGEKYYDEAAALELELRKLRGDPAAFARLTGWRQATFADPLLERQVEILYLAFAGEQVPEEMTRQMVALSTEVGQSFNDFRGSFEGRNVSANEILDLLGTETDSAHRQAAWEASKQVGPVVAERMIRLVKLRNEAARKLGYANFYEMQMRLSEQDPAAVEALFARLDDLTREPFRALKADLDASLARRYGIAPADLRPWHYEDPFFQEAPAVTRLDLDSLYRGKDVAAVARTFFEGIGLPAGDVLDRSDLFEKPGKDQSAYCIDIDRSGDVRVLANLKDDLYWMDTILHELGHAVYQKGFDPALPFELRDAAHSFTTEAVALWFGRLSRNASWVERTVGLPPEGRDVLSQDTRANARLMQLVFARWSLVMVNFERALYADPDADLNRTWWDMVERYQMVHRPDARNAPDWATKSHLISTPVYYHNYLMGEMLASQFSATLARDVLGGVPVREMDLVGRSEVGRYFVDRVFKPGRSLPWADLVVRATGQPLGPEAYVEEFLKD